MNTSKSGSAKYKIQLPSDLDYIPPLRQFVSDIARGEGFSKKICFRMEIIVDELCTNAIIHGAQDLNGKIYFSADICSETIEFAITNRNGSKSDIENLKNTIKNTEIDNSHTKGKGIAIARVLSNDIKISVSQKGETIVKVKKKNVQDDQDTKAEKYFHKGNR